VDVKPNIREKQEITEAAESFSSFEASASPAASTPHLRQARRNSRAAMMVLVLLAPRFSPRARTLKGR
jgi:hypothetical protein